MRKRSPPAIDLAQTFLILHLEIFGRKNFGSFISSESSESEEDEPSQFAHSNNYLIMHVK